MAISYGKASQGHIEQLHPDLQRLLWAYADVAPEWLDIAVTCSFRGEAEQNKAFAEKASKVQWPNSAHNRQPAWAFDFIACENGKRTYDREEMLMRQGAIRLVAAQIKVPLRRFIDWDAPHVERLKGV
jgi:hypothetical protein